ncbi:MAG: MarC family protein [Desulfatiglandales bacterium]
MEDEESMDLNYFVSSFIAIFIIVDPIANVPMFASLLSNFKPEHRKGIIRKAVMIATTVLILFTVLGASLLRYLGVEIYSFNIAGGILLFLIALEMLFGRHTATRSSVEEEDEAKKREDIAATPLAVPMLSGPGAITAGIVLFNSAPSIVDQVALLLVIGLVFLVAYAILSKSEKINDTLGEIGTKVITRIMGLILAAIAVQFVVNGVREAISIG